MSDDPFAPLNGAPAPKPSAKSAKAPKFVSVVPVPEGAPAPYKTHSQLGDPAGVWTYRDELGRVLGYAYRFNRPDGSKEFRPLTACRPAEGGKLSWRWQTWIGARPLYGLDRLAERPAAPVVLCEGEKAADAAARLLPGHVTIASAGGSKQAAYSDWSPLRGRDITIWPDADEPGAIYAPEAARLMQEAGAAAVRCVVVPDPVSEGWDAADALAEGWSPDRATGLIAAAKPVSRPTIEARPAPASAPLAAAAAEADDEGKRGPGRPSMQDALLDIAKDYELWHTPKRDAYASMLMPEGHRENWRLRSDGFVQRLRLRAHEATGRIPSKSNLEEVIGLLEARAVQYGPRRKEWLRVGRLDGNLYLDLGCDRWRAVEISPRGIRILDSHSLPFVRTEGMQPLPEPEFGSDRGIDELRPFVNTNSEEDFTLVVAWVLQSLCAADEFPLLVLNGEQGTGKSTLSKNLRSIVDPHAASTLTMPKEDRDLFVLAGHMHLMAFDNLSKVEGWLSDCLCSIATGSQLAARSMYTDSNLTILDATRPMILNGIPALTDRPDLANRSVTVRLRPVAEEERRASTDIKRDWEAARPRILGTFLEALSTGLRNLELAEKGLFELPEKLPRMAGFARLVVAAAPGLNLDGNAVLSAYLANQSELANTAFENNPVANAVVEMMGRIQGGLWKGKPAELLARLSEMESVSERVRNSFAWPKTAQAIGTAMTRIAPALRARGFHAESWHSGGTIWEIRKL